ncbi:MAG TPA: hypothetical protein VFO16_17870 [Pseudonocardiaceae bacterium]|nr:hypothetical protein [Pseudonocardiaceae bacterium]
MSVLAATVTLAWGCLAILTLAMAGMLRQLRELRAEVAALGARLGAERGTRPWRAAEGRRLPELAGAGPALLLVLDPGCGLCDAVHEPFSELTTQYPGIRFEVLSPRARWTDAPGIRSRVDPGLVRELDLPWAPALLHVAEDGTVLAGQPVSSPERIGAQVAGLMDAAMSR